jgi:hypothetical protein
MIINVFSFVFYSSSAMFVIERKSKTKITKRNKVSVFITLIKEAITTCNEYFFKWGPNPVLPSWFEDVQKKIVANEFVLQQYQDLVTGAKFSTSGEAVARKKDLIVSLIGTGSWGNCLNFYSIVTVAISHHLLHDNKQSVLSLGEYLESQIEQDIKGDECLTFITRTFLKYLVVPPKNEGILHTIPYRIPTVSEYALIEDVVTKFKSRSNSLGKKKRTAGLSYLEKFQIERLITLIGSVDIQLFNKVHVAEICKSKGKKSDM